MDDKIKKFIELKALTLKSYPVLADELGVSEDELLEWTDAYMEQIMDRKAREYDAIVEQYGLNPLSQYKYLAALYERLQHELDNRDFSGLPTDKLYNIMMDVMEKTDQIRSSDVHTDLDFYDDDFPPVDIDDDEYL
ncbi:MAG: hypothetical protein GF313_08580 [Caldithrix sp.]|nr:hypothetical protein [Caldithrix sp.]